MALTLTITNAGRAALVNAAHDGTAPVRIAAVHVTANAIVPSATTASLPGGVKPIATISGDVVAADTIHLIVRDESADSYAMRSFALVLADGTFFAVYGQPDVIVEKSSQSMLLLAIDVRFADIGAAQLSFGNANFLNPPATVDRQGVVELATEDEAITGTDAVRAVTPRGLSRFFGDRLPYRPVRQGGGSGQMVNSVSIGWSGTRLKAQVDQTDLGNLVFDSAIADVWRATNDGAGSGLDSDMLDGRDGSWYTDIIGRLGYTPVVQGGRNNRIIFGWNGTDRIDVAVDQTGLGQMIFTQDIANVWRASNDGAGSGLDADLLDGVDGSYYTNIPARLGYTPVQLGTGVGQLGNSVKLGWGGARLKATVDAADLGNVVFDGNITDVWRSTNDGAGSGLDADLLDGRDSGWFTDIAGRLGYTPVRQNGVANVITIGWNGTDRVTAVIDNVAVGQFAFTTDLTNVWRATNDGAGSGLDADMLDGRDGGWYTDIPGRLGYTPVRQGMGAGQVASTVSIGWGGTRLKVQVDQTDLGNVVFDGNIADVWRLTNDGAGSGLDADMLDGRDGGWYSDISARLGYTPLRQGGGAGQLGNGVSIGWSGTRLKAQVDQLDIGNVVFDVHVSDVWRATNDGAGSGLDADLLDGRQAADFPLRTDFEARLAPSGYQKLPGGMIRQWGETITTDSSGISRVVFPIPFPNACLNASATNNTTGLPVAWAGAGNMTKTGMTVGHCISSNVPAGAGTSAFWEAIGY